MVGLIWPNSKDIDISEMVWSMFPGDLARSAGGPAAARSSQHGRGLGRLRTHSKVKLLGNIDMLSLDNQFHISVSRRRQSIWSCAVDIARTAKCLHWEHQSARRIFMMCPSPSAPPAFKLFHVLRGTSGVVDDPSVLVISFLPTVIWLLVSSRLFLGSIQLK